jgi:hypothetical protein
MGIKFLRVADSKTIRSELTASFTPWDSFGKFLNSRGLDGSDREKFALFLHLQSNSSINEG